MTCGAQRPLPMSASDLNSNARPRSGRGRHRAKGAFLGTPAVRLDEIVRDDGDLYYDFETAERIKTSWASQEELDAIVAADRPPTSESSRAPG